MMTLYVSECKYDAFCDAHRNITTFYKPMLTPYVSECNCDALYDDYQNINDVHQS